VIDLASEVDINLATPNGRVRVLLIEHDPLFAKLVASILEEVGTDFVVSQATSLGAAMTKLAREPFELILTELDLPDRAGPTTVGTVRAFAPGIPIVVLSDTDDVLAAVEAIRQGADEYIVKGRFSIDSLVWLVRLVLERHRRPATDPGAVLTDPATGLATLPALQMAGQQCLLIADRAGLHAGVAFLEIKSDPHRALTDWEHLLLTLGNLLQQTLRRCDLISRLPGGEMAVLLVSDGSPGRAVDRLNAALSGAGMAAEVLMGFAPYDSEDRSTVETLLEEARRNAHTVLQ
jgi:DNA-binding response OmpR family regulator